jgi:hypothetical protein
VSLTNKEISHNWAQVGRETDKEIMSQFTCAFAFFFNRLQFSVGEIKSCSLNICRLRPLLPFSVK